jgi:pimeloyl-ACP methyl ester carboxylesterase
MIERFVIDVPQAELDELRRRIRATRWPDHVADDGVRGTQPSALRRLLDYWAGEFDWRAVEARINGYEHIRVDVGGGRIHAMLAGDPAAPPLLLLHGWPDSFLRFERMIPLLADRFRLVIPSIPGYGFSDRPTAPGMGPDQIADRMALLMTELGHPRFGVHGGDIGSGIANHLAARHADRVTGVHFTSNPSAPLFALALSDPMPEEAAWAAEFSRWNAEEGAYAQLQRTKPQTLAASLSDSPAGLASWFLEKYQAWVDGDAIEALGLELLATNATLYWVTGTAGSSVRYYYDARLTPPPDRVDVRAGFAIFPRDIAPAPRSIAERSYRVERWAEPARGGHFAAWEQPELLADELREFFG